MSIDIDNIGTIGQLERVITYILPNADIQHDNDGQIVIYTGLTTNNWPQGDKTRRKLLSHKLVPFDADKLED